MEVQSWPHKYILIVSRSKILICCYLYDLQSFQLAEYPTFFSFSKCRDFNAKQYLLLCHFMKATSNLAFFHTAVVTFQPINIIF